MENRDSNDYFFNKSDLDKMKHFENLIERYKLCNKVYYYYNSGSNLWIEERTDDSVINRICEETQNILEPEKKHVMELLLIARNKLNVEDKNKFDEINEALKEFGKFINKEIKEARKKKISSEQLLATWPAAAVACGFDPDWPIVEHSSPVCETKVYVALID
jgi:hypothetical protein